MCELWGQHPNSLQAPANARTGIAAPVRTVTGSPRSKTKQGISEPSMPGGTERPPELGPVSIRGKSCPVSNRPDPKAEHPGDHPRNPNSQLLRCGAADTVIMAEGGGA